MHPTRQQPARLALWTALFGLVLLGGCAGDGPAPHGAGGQFAQLQANIFNQHCLSAGCHNAQSQAGGLNLSPGASHNQLVNVDPNNPAALSAGLLRVQPFNPGNSYLLAKVTNPGVGEGSRMPLGMEQLAQSDIDAIEAWIVAGAPRDATAGPSPSETPVPASPTPAPPTATATLTGTPADTSTATATVTGTPPPTSTATSSPTITATPSPSPTPTMTPTLSMFGEIQTTIFNTSCVDSFCHDVAGMSGGLVLVEGQSYANLVGVAPMNDAALQAGMLRVDPGNPSNSFLVLKLGNPAKQFGDRMPFGKLPLTAAQKQLITDWITAGAMP